MNASAAVRRLTAGLLALAGTSARAWDDFEAHIRPLLVVGHGLRSQPPVVAATPGRPSETAQKANAECVRRRWPPTGRADPEVRKVV